VPLTPTAEIVDAAVRGGHGVGAFNVIQLEHAYAVVAGAEQAGSPVLLQISENCVRYHGSLAPLVIAALALAAEAAVPVAVHLDHVESARLVDEAVEIGVGSVMFDASTLSYEDNVAATKDIARRRRAREVWAEGVGGGGPVVVGQALRHRAAGRGQRHLDDQAAVLLPDVVDEAHGHDVEAELGIDDPAQRLAHELHAVLSHGTDLLGSL
jgi:hypothetical protein